MAKIEVKCPYCGEEDVVKYGKSKTGKQRFMCRNENCDRKVFQLEYEKNAYKPGIKEAVVEMAMNGAGTRDTGRVLKISKDTVTSVLKKTKNFVKQVNEDFLKKTKKETDVEICAVPLEMDEMWSFYHDKKHQVWLWWAVNHETNTPLAFTFGTREHKYLDELLFLLKPFPIGKVYTDNNFAYKTKINEEQLIIGKKNTQQIERDHLTLRTRIKRLCRKTICFSKSLQIHKAIIGTFGSINIYVYSTTSDK